MKNLVNVKWVGGMAFEADSEGHKILLDASVDNGGKNEGPRPKPLMLMALGGCTGMDVVSILKKMQVNYDELNIKIEGVVSEEHPKKYTEITVTYQFKGKDIPLDKVQKAINLSEDKYCGVNAVYKEVIKMDYKIEIIEP
jgi:putative redox protein